MGVTTPEKPKRLIAAIDARIISVVTITRIRATSRSSVVQGRKADLPDDFRSCRISEVSPSLRSFVAREGPPQMIPECIDLAPTAAINPRKSYIPGAGSAAEFTLRRRARNRWRIQEARLQVGKEKPDDVVLRLSRAKSSSPK